MAARLNYTLLTMKLLLGSSATALDAPQKAEQEEEEVSPAVWRCCGIQKTPIPIPMTPNFLVL